MITYVELGLWELITFPYNSVLCMLLQCIQKRIILLIKPDLLSPFFAPNKVFLYNMYCINSN